LVTRRGLLIPIIYIDLMGPGGIALEYGNIERVLMEYSWFGIFMILTVVSEDEVEIFVKGYFVSWYLLMPS
jgi:hypothetical protein